MAEIMARVGTFNCAAWGKNSMSKKQINGIVRTLQKMGCSIYCLTECPEWLRNHIRGTCKCSRIAHRRFSGKRWLVRARGSQAILRDSQKWRSGPYEVTVFGPTSYHGGLWETLTQTTTKAVLTVGAYHLSPDSVSSHSYQETKLKAFLAGLPGKFRVAGGDGVNDPSWATGWKDAAASFPNRKAPTYQGKSVTDRIFANGGVTFRGYIVVNSSGASDHNGVVSQITLPGDAE